MVCSYTVALVGRKGFSWVLRKKQNMQIFSFNFEACKFSLNLTATGSKTEYLADWGRSPGDLQKVQVGVFHWSLSWNLLLIWVKAHAYIKKSTVFFQKVFKDSISAKCCIFHISKRPDLDEQKEVYAPIKWPQLRLESLRMIVTVPREQLIWQSMSSIWYAIKYPMKLKFPLIEKKNAISYVHAFKNEATLPQ